MITRDRQATRRTVMPAVSQPLAHGSTAGAFLRRARSVDLDAYPCSFYRFHEEDHEEQAPADIMHGFGQHAAGQSFDVQVFNEDHPVLIDELTSDLVMKIAALVSHMRVRPLQRLVVS